MSDLTFHSEMLSRAVEEYLEARYPGAGLDDLRDRSIQEHDGHLARQLYNWRDAANWPQPEVIGESRCVDCKKVMEDEPSAYEDETVCATCAKGTDAPLGGGDGA